jgi:aminopeptidase YwaD
MQSSHRILANPKSLRKILIATIFSLQIGNAAVEAGVVDSTTYQLVDGAFSGSRAFDDVAYYSQFWRIAGGESFDDCLAYTVDQLTRAGFSDQPGVPSVYWIEEEDINTPVWTPSQGELRVVKPDRQLLHSFNETPMTLCLNSFTTDVTSEVVFVGSGTRASDYRNKDVKGKIVLGRGEPRMLYRRAVVERGALGILSGYIQGYNRPDMFPDAIHSGDIPYDPSRKSFGMMVSTKTFNYFARRLRQGMQVRAQVKIKSSFEKGTRRTLVAEIPGVTKPDERIVLVGHIDHEKPGANDNASGSATMLEIARTMNSLIEQGSLMPPGRTITFLWVDEYEGTTLWMNRNPEALTAVQAVFVVDMVGEKTEITGGPFRLERMPDPSAIWLRPPDEHTPWGAGAVDRTDIRGHYLNDFFLSVCLQRAAATGWDVHTNPWEGGSDHDLFLKRGLPAVLSWHFPDYFYHTSLDDLDKVDPDELKHVGVAVSTAALTLANADNATVGRMLADIQASAEIRFDGEERNSRNALQAARDSGGNVATQYAEEQEILSAWEQWYEETFESLSHVPVEGISAETRTLVEAAKAKIQQRYDAILNSLKPDNSE